MILALTPQYPLTCFCVYKQWFCFADFRCLSSPVGGRSTSEWEAESATGTALGSHTSSSATQGVHSVVIVSLTTLLMSVDLLQSVTGTDPGFHTSSSATQGVHSVIIVSLTTLLMSVDLVQRVTGHPFDHASSALQGVHALCNHCFSHHFAIVSRLFTHCVMCPFLFFLFLNSAFVCSFRFYSQFLFFTDLKKKNALCIFLCIFFPRGTHCY